MSPLRPLAQVALSATTLTDIYTADSASSGFIILRSLAVCNRAASSASFRIAIALGGAANATKQYLFYDTPLVPNDTFTSALEIGLSAGDVVRAYASNANLSITLFGA